MEAIEKFIDEQRDRFKVPGLAVSVVKGDEVLLESGFGQRDSSAGLPAGAHTIFAIGSSTKAFTATLIGALVDDGLLEWDKPVRNYMPSFRMNDPVASEQMTPRDLLCHRSGLPRHDLVWYNNTTSSRDEIIGRLRHLKPNRSFREVWQYNNLMFLTAGYLAGELMGCSWEEAVKRRLLDPLGMERTNFSVAESQKTEDYSLPYLEKDDEVIQVPFRNIDLVGPAGSINSCISDMSRWVRVNLNGGKIDGTEVISPSALAQLQAPAMVMPGGPGVWPESYGTGYALGWFLESYRGHKIVHHGGNIDGFTALMLFAPRDGIGVAVLSNLNGTQLPTAISYRVLDELLGLDPLPWSERFHGTMQQLRGGMKEAREHREASAKQVPPSHALEDYAGAYADDGYGRFTVTLKDGELVPDYQGIEFVLRHRHFDVWDLRIEMLQQTIPAKFETDFEGNIARLVVPMEPSVAPIVFNRLPDENLSDPDRLSRLVGKYRLGPVTLTVELVEGELVATQDPGAGRVHLVPSRDWSFTAKEAPAMTLEFILDDEGRPTKIMVPGAALTRVAEDAS